MSESSSLFLRPQKSLLEFFLIVPSNRCEKRSPGARVMAKTKKDHASVLKKYEQYVLSLLSLNCIKPLGKWVEKVNQSIKNRSGGNTARPLSLPHPIEKGMLSLELHVIKDSFRWFASKSKGRLDSEKMTAKSLNSQAERFFAVFKKIAGNKVPERDRLEIYDVSGA